MKKHTLILALFLFALTLQAQIDKSKVTIDLSQFQEEEAQLQTNTDLVLVGEYLYYKMFALSNGKLSNISKIGYVELIDANNNTIVKHILNLKNSAASQRIFIPTELKTGHYKLIAYTNWTKNNLEKSYFAKNVYVINAFSNTNQNITTNNAPIQLSKVKTLEVPVQNNNNIVISTPKQTYSNRELVTIDVETNTFFKDGNYSLSINKVDSIALENTLKDTFIAETPSNTLFIPEMRGQLITGTITNTVNPLDIKNKNVALSVPGKNFDFKISETNAFGQFFFNLDTKLHSNSATFQVIEDNNNEYKIEINKGNKNNYANNNFSNLEIDNNLKYTLENRNIKNQIENAYYQNKKDSLLTEFKTKSFYKTKEKLYVLNEYTRFKTVRETFIEIPNEAGLRKDGDNYRIIVYDRYDEKKSQAIRNIDPLVIVDGMIVQNNNDLVNYDSYKIESIGIVVGQYLYGTKLYQGIISISTSTKDFKTSIKGDFITETALNLPEDETLYFQPEYLSSADNKRVPDYRRQLLWVPKTNLNEVNNSFTTYTSDDKGTYKVTVEGYNTNGEYILSASYFNVK
ncbi:hypothetical protein [Lacinutrix mariniflava]|uniref:hypothetical protein n=1 Tax=Lacinutrix mariniflava TaxID=342955 RepID=UPI0006E261CA|nr:hypothetical protein [Lacinutrix mariniflava]